MLPSAVPQTAPRGAGSIRPVAGPTAPNQRIATLDILRGLALLGILVLNIDNFSGPEAVHDVPVGTALPAFVGWHAQLDVVILAVKWMFFEGKMRTLFSMLFGAGIVLLTERFEHRGQGAEAADIFYRRNLWLLLFGAIHGTLIWGGDILSQYALVALLCMYPLRRLVARTLIILGLAIGIIGGLIGLANFVGAPATLAAEQLRIEGRAALAAHRTPTAEQAAAIAAEAKEKAEAPAQIAQAVQTGRLSFLDSIGHRASGYTGFVTALFTNGLILEVVGSMMLGMGLFKGGYLTGMRSRRLYLSVAATGYAIALPIAFLGISMAHADGFSAPAVVRWLVLPYSLQIFAGAVANASILLLIVRSGWLKPVTGLLGNVGRTAFSNYIATSLLCQLLFAWGPWKLYGAIEYYQQLYVVAAVWMLNLVFSALWLRTFAYGPLEWGWRSLVYWKPQPMLLSRVAG
ncbi:uncharacterized protein FHS96_003337 [Sphingomonas zeicaulis]|uniref:DUF418 domain-containing protein n=1 Tax=Sphingomonas zeicaulis TaxID=1632740 RepID=UPI003D1C578B